MKIIMFKGNTSLLIKYTIKLSLLSYIFPLHLLLSIILLCFKSMNLLIISELANKYKIIQIHFVIQQLKQQIHVFASYL